MARGLVGKKDARELRQDDPERAVDFLRFLDLDDRYYDILKTFIDDQPDADTLYNTVICNNDGFVIFPESIQRLEAYIDAYTLLKQELDAGRVDLSTCSKILYKSPDEIHIWISENRRVMATVDRYLQAGLITDDDLKYAIRPGENPQETLRELKEKAAFNIKMHELRDHASADALLSRLAEITESEG